MLPTDLFHPRRGSQRHRYSFCSLALLFSVFFSSLPSALEAQLGLSFEWHTQTFPRNLNHPSHATSPPRTEGNGESLLFSTLTFAL